jgi:hypothetical protein
MQRGTRQAVSRAESLDLILDGPLLPLESSELRVSV